MLGDLRATLQQTHAPAARWTVMMAWLKRWWPTLGPGAQEEAVAYLSGHADRLADHERVAPDWLVRELMWCPDSPLGVLPRRVVCDMREQARLAPVLACWRGLRVHLQACEQEGLVSWPAEQIASLKWHILGDEGEALISEVRDWLGALRGIESMAVIANTTHVSDGLLDALRASSETLRSISWDSPATPVLAEAVAAARSLQTISWGGQRRRGAPLAVAHQLAALAEAIGQAAWGPSLERLCVCTPHLLIRHWRQIYPERLAARLVELAIHEVPQTGFAREDWLELLGRFTSIERVSLGRACGAAEDLLAPEVLGDRLGALKTLRCYSGSEALVPALCALEHSPLEALALSPLHDEPRQEVYRWLAKARPPLEELWLGDCKKEGAREALLDAARAGALRHLTRWSGDSCGHAEGLHVLTHAPGSMPALRDFSMDHLATTALETDRLATSSAPPLQKIDLAEKLDASTARALLGWLDGDALVSLDLLEAELDDDSLRALGAGHPLALESLNLRLIPTQPDAEAWCDLLNRAPWLQKLTMSCATPLPVEVAHTLLNVSMIETLELHPVDLSLALALRDALRVSDRPLRLRYATLHTSNLTELQPVPQPLAAEISTLLQARAPGVEVYWSDEGEPPYFEEVSWSAIFAPHYSRRTPPPRDGQ